MILGLFTELLSTGGIQRAGRHTAAVLASWAEHRRMPFRFISLNDPQGLHRLRIAELEFSVSGYGRSKVPFILAALRAARRKPKLILAAHPHLAPVVRAMNLLAPAARTLIITHGIEVWNPLKSLRRQALRAADCVLAPSTDTARRVAEVQGVAPEKICVLPWGLDPPFAASQDDCPEGALPDGFPAGRVILTVGRWASNEGYKGADTLILALLELLNSHPDLSLAVVGEGDDRPRLERLALLAGAGERVRFFSSLTQEQLRACYARCEVFALPSAGEGFGLVFLEAMAHGKPVIGGAHGGTPDLIENGVTGLLVPHGDVERLALALQTLLDDASLREALGRRGRELVFGRYRFEHFVSRMNAVLEELCAS